MIFIVIMALAIDCAHGGFPIYEIDNRPGCYVDPAERVACAGAGVTKAECKAKGCCFISARRNTIWCFKLKESADAWKCAVPMNTRVACAGAGVTPAECKGKGCCFNSSYYGTVWCFKPQE
uniref:Trefoil factor bomaggin n=1 Tax=Bombina maxima TaxID=161274 RepID=Q533G7_BOMMX|nr:trefoil factor bomaggin [Bombina maxima]